MYRTYDFLTVPTKARNALVTCEERVGHVSVSVMEVEEGIVYVEG